jgi:hypoxanthine phosphoribosyltransferase
VVLVHPHLSEILYSEQELSARVKTLAAEIDAAYFGRQILLVGILKGSFIFLADLCRALTCDCRFDFLIVSSYGNRTESSGVVRIVKDLSVNIENLDVLIVEDILDSGFTMRYIMEMMSLRRPASLKLCALFDKPDRRKADIKADYAGFAIPDKFVVGYGLDYSEKYRNIPYLGVLSPEFI